MLCRVTANRTSLRGVGGVYKYNRNPGERRLVKYLLPQIVERPTMQLGTLIASSPYPVTNTLEVLKSDTAPGAFRTVHELFTDSVVHVFGKALLLAGEFLETALGGLRALLLQAFSLPAPSFSDRINPVPGELFAVGGGGNVGNT